ncbi:MAG: hypothetical protein OXG49_16860 [Chloroflexi bacterium]|nr:hypothetical protein [Chloroflexota bacterium]
MDGWVLAEVFNTEGEIGALPDATNSFVGIATAESNLYDGPSTKWFDKFGALDEGEHILVIGRNVDGTWFKSPQGWLDAAALTNVGDISLLPITPSGVIITAKTRTFILKEPDLSAEFVDVFEAGDEALAIGQAGAWFQIAQGWVAADAVEMRGDAAELPFAGDGIPFVLKKFRNLFDIPNGKFIVRLGKGEELLAIGRNQEGTWLQVEAGWTFVGERSTSVVEMDENIMSLPITDGTGSRTSISTSSRPTPAPKPSSDLDARTIRTLIARHTDDIRILDIETASNATTIEYDLKPWPFVPNESIANEVAFKIICAIRNGQPIPDTLKFIGHTHFKSEVGRKFTGPSVEMHISAGNANRIVCRGNDPSDINWRRIASRFKSYPIPRGASIDYD